VTESEDLWVFIAGGVLGLPRPRLASTRPAPLRSRSRPCGSSRASTDRCERDCWRIWWFFAEAGAFVFGSGLAIVPFLYGRRRRPLPLVTERQFLDAVAVAMITPGPVVITTAFIGYLVAGPLGRVWPRSVCSSLLPLR